MDLFQNNEFIHPNRNSDNKVQTCVTSVHEFVWTFLDNVAHFRRSGENVGSNISQDASFFRFGIGVEKLRETNLPLTTHQNNEVPPDLGVGCVHSFGTTNCIHRESIIVVAFVFLCRRGALTISSSNSLRRISNFLLLLQISYSDSDLQRETKR
mmetsp:Transcript_33540/g.79080  ORF Transcript_33540/g.79080 Transcript_33540/m.79080 type:complete len:154 (+) Transcript_33540:1286-1747(+)